MKKILVLLGMWFLLCIAAARGQNTFSSTYDLTIRTQNGHADTTISFSSSNNGSTITINNGFVNTTIDAQRSLLRKELNAIPVDSGLQSEYYRKRGEVIKKFLDQAKGYKSASQRPPKLLLTYCDSLEVACLNSFAQAAAISQNRKEKILSLKDLAKFYLENERVGDNAYLFRIQRELAENSYRVPAPGIGLQMGLAFPVYRGDISLILGRYYPENSVIGERSYMNGFLMGLEFYPGNIYGMKVGFQVPIAGPSICYAAHFVPVFATQYDYRLKTNNSLFDAYYVHNEFQYHSGAAVVFFSYSFMGYFSDLKSQLADIYLNGYTPVQFGVRLQLAGSQFSYLNPFALLRWQLANAVYRKYQ